MLTGGVVTCDVIIHQVVCFCLILHVTYESLASVAWECSTVAWECSTAVDVEATCSRRSIRSVLMT